MEAAPATLARPLAGPPLDHQQEDHQLLARELADLAPPTCARLVRLSVIGQAQAEDVQALTLYAADLVTLASLLDGPETAVLYQQAVDALDALPGGAGQALHVRLAA